MTTPGFALVFPGQGSQSVGMGHAWSRASERARETFAEADDVLGFPLSRLCWEGPEDELQLTANTQPALLTVSVAIHRALAGLKPVAVAGHSLGEYSALVAAGVLTFADALRLVRRRGEVMQAAVAPGVGAMAAVLSLEPETVAEVAEEAAREVSAAAGEPRVCAVANYNSPVQTVIAGHADAVARAGELASERGARRVVDLPVSAPFHCSLMAPAREAMAAPLAEADFQEPRLPVVVNIDARPVTSGAAARDALIRQIDGAVRWSDSVRVMAEELGARAFLEVGAGQVLSGLSRRILREAEAKSLAEPVTAQAALGALGIDARVA